MDGIRVGATTRSDLDRLIGIFETNASDTGFFWARWEEAMLPYEWYSGSGTERDWRIRNVLARFDGRGTLTGYRLCSERELIECLYSFAAQASAPAGFGEPLTCSAERTARAYGTDRFHGKITFDAQGANLTGHSGGVFRPTGAIGFHVDWRGIDRIRVRYGSSPHVLHLSVHFEPQRDRVDYVEIDVSPADTRRLIRGLSHAKAQRKTEAQGKEP